MASNKRTPCSKKCKQHDGEGANSAWQEIFLSPTPSWSPAPDAVQISLSEDITPTPTVSPRFGFDAPGLFQNLISPKSSPSRGYGFLSHDHDDLHRQNHFKKTLAMLFIVILWLTGAASWNSLIEKSQDPFIITPPLKSPSAKARAAFSKYFTNDLEASPSLWIVLEASTTRRVVAPNDDSHSFTDDMSNVYAQGKTFCSGLTSYLEKQFNPPPSNAVRVTSLYSLQLDGLDYVARNMVTPDGSMTMIKIQYCQETLGIAGVARLKQSILDYGRRNQPFYLDLHYAGLAWNPSQGAMMTLAPFSSIILAFISLVALCQNNGLKCNIQWAFRTFVGTVTTLSLSSLMLTHAGIQRMTPLAVTAMVMMSYLYSIHISKFQMHNRDKSTEAYSLLRSCLFFSIVFASFCVLPSPTLQSISVAATITTVGCFLVHACLIPMFGWASNREGAVKGKQLVNLNSFDGDQRPLSQNNSKRKITAIITSCILIFFAFQSRRLHLPSFDNISPISFMGAASLNDFHALGETVGHGRLIPYRILFDGHKHNQSLTSLGGYDIVQMVIDELTGITLSSENNDEAAISGEEEAGSTHVGEEFAEVQHLIKKLIAKFKLFKEEQQREFDHYHHQRQEYWDSQQYQDDSNQENVRCKFNVNSGIGATIYNGIAVLENERIPQSLYSAANICRGMEPRCPSEALHLLNVLEDATTTPDHLTTYVNVNLGVDPFSTQGEEWLRLARESLDRLQADPRILGGVEVHIGGPAAEWFDFRAEQRKSFLKRLAIFIGIVAISIAYFCHSKVSALQIVLTWILTFLVSVGALVLLYQDHVNNIPFLANAEWLQSNTREGPMGALLPFSIVIAGLLSFAAALLPETLYRTKQSSVADGIKESTKCLMGSLLLLNALLSMRSQSIVLWPLLATFSIACERFWIRARLAPLSLECFTASCKLKRFCSNKKPPNLLIVTSNGSDSDEEYVGQTDDFVDFPHTL